MSVNIKVSNEDNVQKNKLILLYVDISRFTQTQQFLLCSTVVFIFFILYGYMQELIFTIEGFQPYGWYLTLVQFGYYSLFGVVEKYFSDVTKRRIPLKTYFLLALLTLGTIGFSNASLGHLNYPTQVIFKCCKLIPVLIGSILIQGKRYGPLDFIAAALMCVGLTLFILADSKISPIFHPSGVIMISLALVCDAVIGNVQEKSMKSSGASNAEIILYSYSIGFFYICFVMLFTGDLVDGVKFFMIDSYIKYGYAFIFSLSGYLGMQVVLTLVRTCGAFVAVTVTTCRKAVTIIISFVFFSKPFVFQYLTSGLIVLLGIYLNLYSKNNPMTCKDFNQKVNNLGRNLRIKGPSRKNDKFLINV